MDKTIEVVQNENQVTLAFADPKVQALYVEFWETAGQEIFFDSIANLEDDAE